MTDRSVKIWMHTQELSNVALPAGFKTNGSAQDVMMEK
jgi:hypothetical protein